MQKNNLYVEDGRPIFFSDVPDELAAQALAQICPHSARSLSSPSPRPAWLDTAYKERLTYFLCTQDCCTPPSWQRAMLAASGVGFQVIDVDSGHCPCISCPKELAVAVSELALTYVSSSDV